MESKKWLQNGCMQFLGKVVRRLMGNTTFALRYVHTLIFNNQIGEHVKLHGLCKIKDSKIGNYTYFGGDCSVKNTTIGNFCSIGPNFICGWGVHPLNGISTSPVFYSTAKQTGVTFCSTNKVIEHLPIIMGNDVFIGANVMIFDGVTIGNGAVIGAGAVVTKNVPAYAIVGGVPARVIRYRFNTEQITQLEKIAWWNFSTQKLQTVEELFFDPETFINVNKENGNTSV